MTKSTCKPQPPSGTAIYTPLFLRLYDPLVLGLINSLAWRCSTKHDLLPLFTTSLGRRHADVGVGSGFFPSTALVNASHDQRCDSITLIDLNTDALQTARRRILNTGTSTEVKTLQADILSPPLHLTNTNPPDDETKFDSITIFYLLHCLPGPAEAKIRTVLQSVVPLLSADGLLVGATILGRGREVNVLGRALLALFNWWGVFGNEGDEEAVFRDALVASFRHVDVWCVGAVMLFRARGPKGSP
ncbi:hypothetical protein CP533_3403 [Ophiocordyceps camponoti-saundersi (nom. inval.)]|nr:hypothetical protein CP533_3403 [Ophiocordyceps camponoti-saundersi (nom. inval.)]